MLKLFVARHSNTFDKGDEVLRVGKRTDLPLSSSGRLQAKQLGTFLKRHHQDLTLLDNSERQVGCLEFIKNKRKVHYIGGVQNPM